MKLSVLPYYKAVPVLRIFLPLLIGIILQYHINFSLHYIIFSLAVLIIGYCLFEFNFLSSASKYRFGWLRGLLLQLIIFFCGVYLTWHANPVNKTDWFAHTTGNKILFLRIDEPLQKKPKTYKALASLVAVSKNDTIKEASGKIIIYFDASTNAATIPYGTIIATSVSPNPIYKNANPGAFDYSRYAAFQKIYHTLYLKTENFTVTKINEGSLLKKWVNNSTAFVISILKKYINNDPKILGIAEALLIGYKADLDKDMQQAYSNTGVVHIIAISGMHLGLIYLMLTVFLGKIAFLKKQKWLKALLIISFLWFFSLMTGAGASVMRSAVMFTIIIIGQTFFKKANIYNAILASAFLLLLYNPYWLWDVGFQLSYAAVIGIVWLQQPIYKKLYFKNWLLKKTWEAVSVTIAAQLLTLPLTIYYFHQFPLIFPISNLVAVPLSSLILFAEIALVALFWIPGVGQVLGFLISNAIWLMNLFIEWIDGIPYSRIENIPASGWTSFLLLLFICFLAGWVRSRKRQWLYGAALSMVMLSFLYSYLWIASGHQHKILIYNAGKNFALDVIGNRRHLPLAADSFLNNSGYQNFYCNASRIHFWATGRTDTLPAFFRKEPFLQYRNKKVFIANKETETYFPTAETKVDLLLISGSPKTNLVKLAENLKPEIVVIGSDNSLWKTEQWKKECSALALRCHTVAQQGAFVLDAR